MRRPLGLPPRLPFYGVGRDDGKRQGEYAGIYYRRDRFERDVTEEGTFWLSDTPEVPGSKSWGNSYPRVVTWIRLIDRSTRRASTSSTPTGTTATSPRANARPC